MDKKRKCCITCKTDPISQYQVCLACEVRRTKLRVTED